MLAWAERGAIVEFHSVFSLLLIQLFSIMTGTVKFFNHEKGWGFITPEDGGKDIFVHHSSASGGTLNEGDNVTFDLSVSADILSFTPALLDLLELGTWSSSAC